MSASRFSDAVGPSLIALLSSVCLLLAAGGGSAQTEKERTPGARAESKSKLTRAAATSATPSADGTFEQSRVVRAEELMQAGRWAEAAAQWEVLTLMRPERQEYASQLALTRDRANRMATESISAAAEARRRGDLQRATTLYLRALSAEPHNATAATALREIEQSQASRSYFNHAQRGGGAGRAMTAAHAPYTKDRQELDMATMLLHQGDYDASVQSLQRYLKRFPQDEAGKRALRDAYAALGKQRIDEGKKEEGIAYLEKARALNGGSELASTVQTSRKDMAQDYYEQGLRLQRTDLDAAIRLWERALEYDPGHAQARFRLEQGRRMQQTVRTAPATSSQP
jgi:tetratricopeptide (TPR) repeat protein